MIEHRLIERMIGVVETAVGKIDSNQKIDPVFVDNVVDFIRFYADRTHHGKEEDILFRHLRDRAMSDEDQRMMEKLIQEHVFGRETTGALVEANERYRGGDAFALNDIKSKLEVLADFYPKHIRKEDKVFFPASRAYFTDSEDQGILYEFHDFDRKMIHEKYESILAGLTS